MPFTQQKIFGTFQTELLKDTANTVLVFNTANSETIGYNVLGSGEVVIKVD